MATRQKSLPDSNGASHAQSYASRVKPEGPETDPALTLETHMLLCLPLWVAQTLIPWCELHLDHQADWELEQQLFKKRLEELSLFSLGRDGFGEVLLISRDT